jgi:hypothetical protein
MISIEKLEQKRDRLAAQLQQEVATVHQLRGAIQVLEDLIASSRKLEEKIDEKLEKTDAR